MKIKKLNIVGFGGLKNKVIDLENGINIVYGSNEQGKTTIMNFIKMMFYGNERSSSSVAKNIRQKYTPWDGGIMAGSIEFENKGRNYRLEREFKKSNSTDKITLHDIDMGTSESVTGDIGEKIFALTLPAFERSVFIGQFGFPENDTNAEGEINQKLSNIINTGDETVSYETVYKRLEKAKHTLMSKSGSKGEYDKNLKQIALLKADLLEAKATHKQYSEFKAVSEKIIKQIELEQNKAISLKAKIDSEQDIRNTEKLKEMLELKAELDKYNADLKTNDGKIVDEIFIRKLEFCISKCDKAQQDLNAEIKEFEVLKNSIDEYEKLCVDASPQKAEELKAQIKTLQNDKDILLQGQKEKEEKLLTFQMTKPKNSNLLTLIFVSIAVILAAFSFVKFFMSDNFLGVVLGAGAVVFAVLGIILRYVINKGSNNQKEIADITNKIADYKIKISEVNNEITVISSRLEAIITALNSTEEIVERQKAKLEQCNRDIEKYRSQFENEKKVLFEFFGCYSISNSLEEIKETIGVLIEKTAHQKEIKQRLNYIARDLGNISYDEARVKLENISEGASVSVDFEAVKAEYEYLVNSINEKKTRLAAASAEFKTKLEQAKNPETIKAEIEKLTAVCASQEEFCNTLDIALNSLTESFAELRRSYGSVLEKTAGEIFSGITGGKYTNMMISKSFDISVEQEGVFGTKEVAYLSSGAADQAYLSLRLALSKLITDSDSQPIFLDDSLAQYDDKRLLLALQYLKDFADKGQIIMFTCHKYICDTANGLGLETKNL